MRVFRSPYVLRIAEPAYFKTRAHTASLVCLALLLAGCDRRKADAEPEIRPVRVIAAAQQGGGRP